MTGPEPDYKDRPHPAGGMVRFWLYDGIVRQLMGHGHNEASARQVADWHFSACAIEHEKAMHLMIAAGVR